MKEGGDEPLAVFEFDEEDESYVDAYASLHAAEGDFFTADGRAVEATIGGKWGLDVSLRVTDHHRSDELRARLAAPCQPSVSTPLADSPLAAAQALIDAKWNARWPRWPIWLDRRLNGSKPTVVQP